mgnify:FL=1
MKNYVEIVERKDKPYLKVFLSVIGSIFFIDFIIFIANKFNKKYPYITNIIVLVLLVFTCSLIIIKFFSKYSYVLDEEKFSIYRLIGKRAFPIVQMDINHISSIAPYSNKNKIEFKYKFIFGKDYKDCYVGRYEEDDNTYYFLFKPSATMHNKLCRIKNN